MPKKPNIRYTNREFDSIKTDLVEYAKRYYPTSFKDFNDASFGSLMLDTVAYVGDVLSYYLDYQANEQFLGTAVEYENVVRLAAQHGYRWAKAPTSTGVCTFYVLIPASDSGGPNEEYAPVLKKGTTVTTGDGAGFVLSEDINFGDIGLTTVPAKIDAMTGQPTWYARKGYGRVISGQEVNKNFSIGAFERFRKIDLGDEFVAEIIRVSDSDGHEYVEVDYLTQDVIYRPVINNTTATKKSAPFIMKAYPAPRRFITERDNDTTYLRFGFGSEVELGTDSVVDPSKVVLQLYGKSYSTDEGFDPKKLLNNDKLGVGPSETTLIVTYRVNDPTLVNVGAKSISTVGSRYVEFNSLDPLNTDITGQVRASIEVENEEAIVGDVSEPDAEEVRLRALSMFASQNRAVTREDYMALSYSMDKKYGAVKRCNIVKDEDSFKNNLNLYVISEDENGLLTKANSQIKQNLKTWLNQYKMINDSIDILDANIVNLGVEFEILTSLEFNKFDILSETLGRVQLLLSEQHFDVGESVKISEILKTISNTQGVVDVTDFRLVHMKTAGYEATPFNIELHKSPNGKYLIAPEDVIFEFRYPALDIKGATK